MQTKRYLPNSTFCTMAAAVLGALLLVGCTSIAPDVSSGQVSVKSPDGTIEMTVRGNGPLTYSVAVDGKAVLADSRLGMKIKDGVTLGANARLIKVVRSKTHSSWENKLGKRRIVRDHH